MLVGETLVLEVNLSILFKKLETGLLKFSSNKIKKPVSTWDSVPNPHKNRRKNFFFVQFYGCFWRMGCFHPTSDQDFTVKYLGVNKTNT